MLTTPNSRSCQLLCKFFKATLVSPINLKISTGNHPSCPLPRLPAPPHSTQLPTPHRSTRLSTPPLYAMPRISGKRRFENELASTMQDVALTMLLDSDSEPEEDLDSEFEGTQTRTTMTCLAHWPSRTMRYPAHDISTGALAARQAGFQSKRPFLNISNTLIEALWLISACTVRALGSCKLG